MGGAVVGLGGVGVGVGRGRPTVGPADLPVLQEDPQRPIQGQLHRARARTH